MYIASRDLPKIDANKKTLHNSIVRDLATTVPGFRTYGFKKAIRDAIKKLNPYERYLTECKSEDCEPDSEKDYYDLLYSVSCQDRLSMVPDGYTISIKEDYCEIHVWEVEVNNRIRADKIERLGWFADNTDAAEFHITLHMIDRFGGEKIIIDESLMSFALANMWRRISPNADAKACTEEKLIIDHSVVVNRTVAA